MGPLHQHDMLHCFKSRMSVTKINQRSTLRDSTLCRHQIHFRHLKKTLCRVSSTSLSKALTVPLGFVTTQGGQRQLKRMCYISNRLHFSSTLQTVTETWHQQALHRGGGYRCYSTSATWTCYRWDYSDGGRFHVSTKDKPALLRSSTHLRVLQMLAMTAWSITDTGLWKQTNTTLFCLRYGLCVPYRKWLEYHL